MGFTLESVACCPSCNLRHRLSMSRPLPGFIGFPDKKMLAVIVPDLFFVDLLPQIDNLAELKLTVYFFGC